MEQAQALERTNTGSVIGKRIAASSVRTVHHFESSKGRKGVASFLSPSATPADETAFSDIRRFAEALKLPLARTNPKVLVVGVNASGTLEFLPCLEWSLEKRVDVFAKLARLVQQIHDAGLIIGPFTPQDVALNDSFSPFMIFPELTGIEGPFVAPEAKNVLQRSVATDIYSLGAILHFVVAGAAPRFGDSIVPRLPDLETFPAGLARIVRKAVCRTPLARYASAKDMLDEIAIYGRYKEVGVAHPDADERNVSGLSRLPTALMITPESVVEEESPTDDAITPLIDPLEEIGGGSAKLGGWRVFAGLAILCALAFVVFGSQSNQGEMTPIAADELHSISAYVQSASFTDSTPPSAHIQVTDTWEFLSASAQRAEIKRVFDAFFDRYGTHSAYLFAGNTVLAHESNRHINYFPVWK